ncbi:MAG: endonuclease/exonuclease/phosphatase family protein [Bacteroidales bacterium]|nr:endonuclease/exonuclease/phosphatase family protein [Bacteroidales bacterium]
MKKLLVLLAIATLVCSSCAQKSAYPKAEGSIRLLQYNVGAFGKYMENSTEMIAAMIQELDADIVSLNEVDSCNRRHNTFQSADLAQALGGWYQTYGRAMAYKSGAYGNAIVSRETFTPGGTIALEKGEGSEYRSGVIAETERFVFVSTHLDHKNHEACLNQARQLSETVKARYEGYGKPVFLAGDMNSKPTNEVISLLQEYWDIITVTDGPTCPCPNPKSCIDYIMILKGGPSCKVLQSAVANEFKNGNVETASDHYPIFVDVVLE